jgi:hypothetical protein|nr:MAG TPA: KH domain [Caudoviricetes sp.]
MAVYREGYKAIEAIKRASKRIYNDACDFGAPTKKGDNIWNYAKQLCDWYGIEGTRKESRYATGCTLTQDVKLIDEWAVSDERKSLEAATEIYTVTFITCTDGQCKGMNGYIYISKK